MGASLWRVSGRPGAPHLPANSVAPMERSYKKPAQPVGAPLGRELLSVSGGPGHIPFAGEQRRAHGALLQKPSRNL